MDGPDDGNYNPDGYPYNDNDNGEEPYEDDENNNFDEDGQPKSYFGFPEGTENENVFDDLNGDEENELGGGDGDVELEGLEGFPDLEAVANGDTFDVLPPWANDENRALNNLVKQKERILYETQGSIQENVDRVAIMKEHLKNVRQEHAHTQALLDAKHKEIDSEKHLHKLSERAIGRLHSEMRTMKKDLQEAQDQVNAMQSDSFTANEKLEKFKLEMNWNQEELLQWSLAAKQKEEDHDSIMKYQRQDNTKITQLLEQVEKHARQAHNTSVLLQKEVTDTKSVQLELDALADTFKEEHGQRQDMIRQWNDAMKAMHKRDDEIMRSGEEIAEMKRDLRDLQSTLSEADQTHAREAAQNRYLNNKLGATERMVASKRDNLVALRTDVESLQDVVATQRGENEKATAELNAATFLNTNLKDLQGEKLRKLDEYTQLVQATKEQLESGVGDTQDLQSRAAQIESLHKQHQDRLAQLNRLLQTSKDSMFKHSHELFNLRKAEANLIAEISGAQGAARNLQSRIKELDQRSLKQQEMLYSIEFQVQQLERTVSHASGTRSVEETVALTTQISKLQLQLDAHKAENHMLNTQVKGLHEDLRAARREYEKTLVEKSKAQDVLTTSQLEVDTEERVLKKELTAKAEMAVQHDELSLEANKLGQLLQNKRETVFDLEKRNNELRTAMTEREKEISLHADVQKAELRACDEAKSNIMRDLRERQIRLDKIKSKYETIAGKLRGCGGVDEDGEPRTQAYYIIAAAQEREELQREGDDLNAAIRRSEKEMMMLAKTLQSLNTKNNAFRQSLHKADPDSAEMQLKNQLEQKQRLVQDGLHKKKALLREMSTDFEERRRLLAELMKDIAGVGRDVQNQDKELAQLRKQIADQEQQVQRSIKLAQSRRTEFRKAHSLNKNETASEELYVSLQEQKRRNTLMLDLVRVFVEEHPNLLEPVHEALDEFGLSLTTASNNPINSPSTQKNSARSGYNGYNNNNSSSGMFPPIK